MKTTFFFFLCQLFLVAAAIFFGHTSSAASNDVQAKDNRVSGGEPDWSTDYAFQVQLKELGQHVCGAVLLDGAGGGWALTAAHCTLGRDPKRLSIDTGNTRSATSSSSVRSLAQVIVHPQFNAATMANNLALLKIDSSPADSPSPDKENLDNLPRRATVHLPSPGQKFTDLVTLVGYGSTSNRVPRESGEKRLVSLPIAALARCRSLYGQNLINSGQLCAGDSYTGAGLCQGDAGSGAVQLDGDDAGEEGGAGRQVLVGVGSFGFDCGNGRYPSVFTAVADYVEWIQNSTTSSV